MARLSGKKIILCFLAVVAASLAFCASPSAAEEEEDPLLGVREGWSWPVVVTPPPDGWESGAGRSIKYAMRAAEREISLRREGIRGREVTFMFSDISETSELPSRLATWRAMKVSVIASFSGAEFNEELAKMCRDDGPSLLLSGGEDTAIRSPDSGRPYPYIFALDLPYYSRANALAEAALLEQPGRVAVITDMLSSKLAKGADLNIRFLRARGVETLDMSAAAYRQDQFTTQVREAGAEGVTVFTCWLDAMATLSIWQSAARRHSGAVIFYSGNPQQILTDADGIVIVDKDVLLERDEKGKLDMTNKIRDSFNVVVDNPVAAARAFALAKWAIGAYERSPSGELGPIAISLGDMGGIPLMDETLSIDPSTHRPRSRKFGLLRIANRTYESAGSVEVSSSEAIE